MFSNRGVTNTCLSIELSQLASKRVCMTSETENVTNSNVGNNLRVAMFKQCTWYDKMQARDLWCSAKEFHCVANINMMFNEVPGCDDSSDGMARRLKFIDFLKVYNQKSDATKNEMATMVFHAYMTQHPTPQPV